MNQQRMLELAERRGALTAHIALQRANFSHCARPLARLLGTADRAVEGTQWLRQHPQLVVAFIFGLAVLRPRRAWRWAKRSFFLWRGYKIVRSQLS